MTRILIKNSTLVNEGRRFISDVFIKDRRIHRIAPAITRDADTLIDGTGLLMLPGVIDDQVHFRDPGLTHKGDIATESRAAVAGGVTSFMDMPNCDPPTLTQDLLGDKYGRAADVSLANYSFYMGASNENLAEILKTDPRTVCGVKIFMGASTGNLLVDNEKTLRDIFSRAETLIATHCEYDPLIRANEAAARDRFGEAVPFDRHPEIRSHDACIRSSRHARKLASEFGTRLHILHLTTAAEALDINTAIPLPDRRITTEVCVHHLWFSDRDYDRLGAGIKCNPAIKGTSDRDALRHALASGAIDVLATDHAPHTWQEKSGAYFSAPSGLPLVQHSLPAMLEMVHRGLFTLEQLPRVMAHNVARCFNIRDRGFIREGCFADLVLVDPGDPWTVTQDSLFYKCGWSPFQGQTFRSRVVLTLVNGETAFSQPGITDKPYFGPPGLGQRMTFQRDR